MAIPQKGSRKIIVDEVSYRWYVRHKPTYLQAISNTGMTFSVQQSQKKTGLLVVKLKVSRPDNWICRNKFAIQPSLVTQIIRHALAQGWQPNQTGTSFFTF